LRFHVASLRKALGDGKDGARYVDTLAGRGYCFVAPSPADERASRGAGWDAQFVLHAPALATDRNSWT
jgi:DNA-binding winged helix-turn-helix (wHTH) protein